MIYLFFSLYSPSTKKWMIKVIHFYHADALVSTSPLFLMDNFVYRDFIVHVVCCFCILFI